MQSERFTLLEFSQSDDRAEFARDVLAGLSSTPKRLSCRYFYDQTGSELFEAICDLPEYYLTRAEASILRERMAQIVAGVRPRTTLIELGSGSAVKTRLLIEGLLEAQEGLHYVPIDIAREMMERSCRQLLDDYAGLRITALAGEYEQAVARLEQLEVGAKLVLWLGSNVGNLNRQEAAGFLGRLRGRLSADDRLLLGIDLKKEREVLERAYDDSRGITARFNRNLLARINGELGGRFQLEAFDHQAVYNSDEGRVEMYLVSRGSQQVPIERLGRDFRFAAGETIHTENSYKYDPGQIEALAAGSGLMIERQWFDDAGRYSLNLLRAAGL